MIVSRVDLPGYNEGDSQTKMSYDISLHDPITKDDLLLDDPHFIRGGTYCVGGTRELHLNITWNYAPHFQKVLGPKGIRVLYGMTGAESICVIWAAMTLLQDDIDPDYWTSTEGNAKAALAGLLAFAQLRPDGIWNGD